MDYRGKTLAPALTYIDGAFAVNVLVDIDSAGAISAIRRSFGALEGEKSVVRLENEALLPGFVNAHSHAFHRQLRGRSGIGSAAGDSFWKWRDGMYAIVENATATSFQKFCEDAFAEMLAAGITTVGEFHYVHHGERRFEFDRAVLRAAESVGIRIVLLLTLYSRSGFDAADVTPQQRRFQSEIDEFCANFASIRSELPPNASLGVAAHSLRAVSKQQLRRLHEFASAERVAFHLHLEEQPKEIEDCERVESTTPSRLLLETLAGADISNLTAVHCTYTPREQLAALGERGAHICVCSLTEGFLGDGVPTLAANDRLCLGADCNNRLCMLEEARWLCYAQNAKFNTRNAAALDAHALLAAATVSGARALGFDAHALGTIVAGAAADFCVVDLSARSLAGIGANELADALVFGCGNAELRRTIVAGVERWSSERR